MFSLVPNPPINQKEGNLGVKKINIGLIFHLWSVLVFIGVCSLIYIVIYSFKAINTEPAMLPVVFSDLYRTKVQRSIF